MVGRVAVVEVVLAEVDRRTLVAGETLAEEGKEAEVEEGRLRILGWLFRAVEDTSDHHYQ